MTYSQMLSVLESSGRSPEQLGKILGISGMTLRRWKLEPGHKVVSRAYESTVVEGIYQLIIDGHLDAEAPAVQAILRSAASLSLPAAMKTMGVSMEDLGDESSQQDRLTEFLGRVGVSERHRRDVDKGKEKISSFKRLGADWKKAITSLLHVVRSPRLTPTEKLVAYGALFYLLNPFDLIPDHIPVFGLMDDFAMLTIASGFYARRALGTEGGSESDT